MLVQKLTSPELEFVTVYKKEYLEYLQIGFSELKSYNTACELCMMDVPSHLSLIVCSLCRTENIIDGWNIYERSHYEHFEHFLTDHL